MPLSVRPGHNRPGPSMSPMSVCGRREEGGLGRGLGCHLGGRDNRPHRKIPWPVKYL